MILKNLEYSEFINDKRYWAIKSFELGKINLLTAKNATGKTRTLKAIDLLKKTILDNFFSDHLNYAVEFSDNSESYKYFLVNNDKRVISEKLVGNEKTYFQRDNTGKGEIYTAQLKQNIEFQIPDNKLAIARRDILQYPYLEKINTWAENVRYYSFGTSMKQEYGKAIHDDSLNGNSDILIEVFAVGELEFDTKFKENVLESMNSIGYNLTYIDTQERADDFLLFVMEKDRDAILTQEAMSQGMFRALSIIIHLTYHAMKQTPTTILIDDIGEGLDFERSSKLIKFLIELAEKNESIQLIMSTNDRFVMNNIPLKYWQLIQRSGGECQVYNYKNSKEIFDEFKYTGLNNFDFLATDFINSKWN